MLGIWVAPTKITENNNNSNEKKIQCSKFLLVVISGVTRAFEKSRYDCVTIDGEKRNVKTHSNLFGGEFYLMYSQGTGHIPVGVYVFPSGLCYGAW